MRPLLWTLFLLALFRPAAAQTYTIREVSSGQSVGKLFPHIFPSRFPEGVLGIGSAGVTRDDDPGHSYTHSLIEWKGHVAGKSDTEVQPGFHWGGPIPRHISDDGILQGRIVDLGTLPHGKNCWLERWNSKGELVGTADTTTGARRAVLYTGGQLKDLGTLPGYEESLGTDLNEKGQVSGYCYRFTDADYHLRFDASLNKGTIPPGSPPPTRAFLYTDGKMKDLGTLPGGISAYAFGMNDKGQIVGSAATSVPDGPAIGSSCEDHAFLYTDGKMIDLNSVISERSSWALCKAFWINDEGQILGNGQHSGVDADFLLTPRH